MIETKEKGVRIVFKRNARRISLSFNTRTGKAQLTAPLWISKKAIQEFLTQHEKWLESRRKMYPKQKPFVFEEGEKHLLLGKPMVLRIHDGEEGVILTDTEIFLTCPKEKSPKDVYLAWAKEYLYLLIKPMVEEKAKEMGKSPSSIRIGVFKSKWGSCHRIKKELTFNVELIRFPLECIEQVVIHEMVHLFVPNHGKDFYQMMEIYFPRYKEIKKKMRILSGGIFEFSS